MKMCGFYTLVFVQIDQVTSSGEGQWILFLWTVQGQLISTTLNRKATKLTPYITPLMLNKVYKEHHSAFLQTRFEMSKPHLFL